MQAFIFVDSARSSAKCNLHYASRLKQTQLLQEIPELTSLQLLVHPTSSSRLLFYLEKKCVSGEKRNCSMLLLVTHMRLGFISSYVNVSSSSSVHHMFICGRQVL